MIDAGVTTFILICSALVILMTPGLAFFYGGFGDGRNVISIIKQSMVSLSITTMLWYAIGYSLCFSGDICGVIGNLDYMFLEGISPSDMLPGTGIPVYAFIIFQLAFAIITPALITGAFVNRISFKAYLAFLVLWEILVYFPFAHMVWGGGWLHHLGVMDFAGGIVIHPLAGMAALASVFYVGRRKQMKNEPHSRPLMALGAGLLWFGWFGFNAGSALAVNSITVLAFVNTQIAAAFGSFVWMMWEWIKEGKPKLVGFLTGAVAGLVAITPAAGFVSVGSAAVIGAIASLICYYAVAMKNRMKWDDALDVWGVHGVGGIIGSIAVGIFASNSLNNAVPNGLLYGGVKFFVIQIIGVVVACTYAFIMTYILLMVVNKITPVKVNEEAQMLGLDLAHHGEIAYQK